MSTVAAATAEAGETKECQCTRCGDGHTTNKDGGVGIAGRDIQVIDPDLVVGTAIVGVDSCFNDQRGLTFSNGPGVAGVCPTAAIAANAIAGTGSAACVAGEIRAVKVVAPESATRVATISVTIKTQLRCRCTRRRLRCRRYQSNPRQMGLPTRLKRCSTRSRG